MSKSTLMRHRSPFLRDTVPGGGGGQPAPAPAPAPPAPAPAPAPASSALEKPDGVTDAEWAALGDPGKNAIVRERQRAAAAEQALVAERAKHTTKPPAAPEPPKPGEQPKTGDGQQPDIAAIVQQAVQAAVGPLLERDATREAADAAEKVQAAVITAAEARLHDATDALAQIDLTTLTDGTGRPDQQKITTALDDLLTRKPHLGKVIDPRRHAPPGTPIGGGPLGPPVPLDDRVKATLARMQQTAGVKFADSDA